MRKRNTASAKRYGKANKDQTQTPLPLQSKKQPTTHNTTESLSQQVERLVVLYDYYRQCSKEEMKNLSAKCQQRLFQDHERTNEEVRKFKPNAPFANCEVVCHNKSKRAQIIGDIRLLLYRMVPTKGRYYMSILVELLASKPPTKS